MGLVLPLGKGVLMLRMLVWIVPLLHHLRRIRRRVRSSIVLRMVVLGVGIVMDRRVSLRRDMVLVVVLTLPAALVHRHGRWDVGAGHHCPAGTGDAFTVSAGQRPSYQTVRDDGAPKGAGLDADASGDRVLERRRWGEAWTGRGRGRCVARKNYCWGLREVVARGSGLQAAALQAEGQLPKARRAGSLFSSATWRAVNELPT